MINNATVPNTYWPPQPVFAPLPQVQTPVTWTPPEQKTDYQLRREALIAYLRSAVNVSDWHAVSDAANDLRVLEAKHGYTPNKTA